MTRADEGESAFDLANLEERAAQAQCSGQVAQGIPLQMRCTFRAAQHQALRTPTVGSRHDLDHLEMTDRELRRLEYGLEIA